MILDVRTLDPQRQYQMILRRFDALAPGDILRVVSDHDLSALCAHLLEERAAALWKAEQHGSREWDVRICKRA